MATVNPYLNFNGECEEAFDFYRSVFGGEMPKKMRMKDSDFGIPIPEGDGNKIMHVALPIGGGTILMGSDTSDAFGPPAKIGTNFSVTIGAESEADANRLFNGLSEGGQATMPMAKAPWGDYFGMFTDKFGIQWMVSYDYKH